MKSLSKRKQSLSSAGEIINSCACRTHPCQCSPDNQHTRNSTFNGLYVSANRIASSGAEPTSVNKI